MCDCDVIINCVQDSLDHVVNVDQLVCRVRKEQTDPEEIVVLLDPLVYRVNLDQVAQLVPLVVMDALVAEVKEDHSDPQDKQVRFTNIY